MHYPKDEIPSFHGPPPRPGLRLATWNIHSAIGADNRMDLHRILSVIEAIDADIIGLQEVGWHRAHHARIDQFAFLRQHTAYEVVECLARDPLRSRFGNALLTRLPVADCHWIDLKVLGHPPRAAVAADLDGPTGRLRAIVAHFGLTPPEREVQATRIAHAIAPHGAGKVPAAVLGDFNMMRGSTRASRVLSGPLPHCISAPTYPSGRPVFALDRIYLSAEWEVCGTRVVDSALARMGSDHLPLVADVVLATQPAAAACGTVSGSAAPHRRD